MFGMFDQWRTWRTQTTAPADTLLTKYQPSDVTAALKLKMIPLEVGVSIVALRAFGRSAAAQICDVVISGWMDLRTPSQGMDTSLPNVGCGHRLFRGRLTLGTKTIDAGQVPTDDRKWGATAAWLEAIGWDATLGGGYNPVGAEVVSVANQEAVLLLPTLGYKSLLIEFDATATTMTALGALWRPVSNLINHSI
jgi:hypothetical protein